MILHIMILDKFLPPFIKFVDEHFGRQEHRYVFITSEKYLYGLNHEQEVEFLHSDKDIFETLFSYMKNAKKILLHGLWRDKINRILTINPYLLQKTIWIMWGGDFYYPKQYQEEHLFVIKNIPYMVNIIDEEIPLVRKLYGAKGKQIKSFVYPTSIFSRSTKNINVDNKTILLGNSAAKDIDHLTFLKKIHKLDDGSFRVLCPLSYPINEENYKKSVIDLGNTLFPNRFEALNEFIPLSKYRAWVAQVNFAIFPSGRQQGISNIVDLVGNGRKVFLSPSVSTWPFLKRLGVTVFSTESLDFSNLAPLIQKNNARKVQNTFSTERLVRDLTKLFGNEAEQSI